MRRAYCHRPVRPVRRSWARQSHEARSWV